VHCTAHLDQNIEPVIPYLDAVLGGFEYLKNPLPVIFRPQDQLQRMWHIHLHGVCRSDGGGGKGVEDCQKLGQENRIKPEDYMQQFVFDA
jgi:hypothetical protein